MHMQNLGEKRNGRRCTWLLAAAGAAPDSDAALAPLCVHVHLAAAPVHVGRILWRPSNAMPPRASHCPAMDCNATEDRPPQ